MGTIQSTLKKGDMQIHERFGMIKVHTAKDPQTNEQFETMEIMRSIEGEKQLQGWLKQISKVNDSQIKEVLILPLKHRFQKSGMCGSSGIVDITYEKYSFILENQIENRYHLKKLFIETEMWYMLYNMIRAANKFQRIKRKIGDVHPANILINDDGQVKLISTCSLPNQITNFDKVIENREAKVFLAPQEIDQDCISRGQYPKVDPCKAEVYSIGMTILSAGTLQKGDRAYEKAVPYRINKQFIQSLIDSFSQKYSMLLTQTVVGMLTDNPTNRKKSSEIYQMLYPYQNQILDLEPFSLPLKVSSQPPVNYQQSMHQQPLYNQPPQKVEAFRPNSYYQPNVTPNQNYAVGNRFSGNPYGVKY